MTGSRAPDPQRVLSFLTDEDFDARIVRALVSRVGELDILSVRDVGLSAAEDLLLIIAVATATDLRDQILHLPH